MHPSPSSHTAGFRLRSLYGIICILALMLPAGAVYSFRFYENELVTQTELELISQGAVLASHYRKFLKRVVPDPANYGTRLPEDYTQHVINDFYTPVYPLIDLSHSEELATRPDPEATLQAADPYAATIGVKYSEMLGEIQQTTLSGLLVLDYNGIIIAAPRSIGDSFHNTEEVRAALTTGHYTSVLRKRESAEDLPFGLSYLSRSTGVRIFAAYPVVEDDRLWGVIYLSRTPQNILKQFHAERETIIALSVVFLLLVLGAVGFIWFTVTRPIRRLVHKTQRSADGDLAAMAPLEQPGTREVEALSRNISRLSYALHHRTRYIRDFAGRTMQAFKQYQQRIGEESERLLDTIDGADKAALREALEHIVQSNRQMGQLMDRLLEFSLAENHIPQPGTSYLMPILNRLQEKYRLSGLRVDLRGEGHCDAIMPADTFETIMTHLLDNALQHEAATVDINLELDEEIVTLRIADDGSGIPEAEMENLFEPFYTTASESGRSGLGLPIAKELATAYGGQLMAEPSDKGAVFVLTLPVVH